jgi:hypothetical protein
MNPSPDPACSSEDSKLVPSRYYAHLSEQREEQEEVALLSPEQGLFPFEEEARAVAIALAGDKLLPRCEIDPPLDPRQPGVQCYLGIPFQEILKEPPLKRIEREVREARRWEAERPQRLAALCVRGVKYFLYFVRALIGLIFLLAPFASTLTGTLLSWLILWIIWYFGTR